MNYQKIVTGILLMLSPCGVYAQQNNERTQSTAANYVKETRELFKRQGRFFVFWGYNRSAYSHSNMKFRGDGYSFRINDIRATDDATNPSSVYINPSGFTVPQFNYRIGYFLNDKNFISFGSDHMKYSMAKQTTRLTGTITKGNNIGTYNNTEVVVGENADVNNPGPSIIDNLPKGFVSNFEHCDGLNDFAAEFGRLDQLWVSANHKNALAATGSVSLGMVIPDTDADVMGQPPKHDMEANKKAYHLAGYSISATMGLQFDFLNHAFLLARIKAGYMNLPDINTTVYGGKASQHFEFLEPMVVIGYSFYILKKPAPIKNDW